MEVAGTGFGGRVLGCRKKDLGSRSLDRRSGISAKGVRRWGGSRGRKVGDSMMVVRPRQ